MEKVILVDENDREIGLMEKMEAHEKVYYIALSPFFYSMKTTNFYFKNVPVLNTIPVDFGRTHAAVTQE